MRRLLPILAAVALAVGASGAVPGRVAACSCVPPVSLAETVARSPELAVFVGSVVAMRDDPTTGGGVATVAVDGRFRGPLLPPVVQARYGGGGDCTIPMAVGERRIFTASRDERGTWFPGLCTPQGVLGTPDGDALLAEAVAAFGPAQPVAAPSPAPAAGPDPVALGAAAALVALLGVGLIGGVVAVARRQRQRTEP